MTEGREQDAVRGLPTGGGYRAGNVHRATSGRFLLGFALALLVVTVLSLRLRSGEGRRGGLEYPTALGDKEYFTEGALGGDGLESPLLQPRVSDAGRGEEDEVEAILGEGVVGLYRRSLRPLPFADALMFRVGVTEVGGFNIYLPPGAPSGVVYLKMGEDLYAEFGAERR